MKDQHALTSRDTFNRYNTLYQGPFTQRARTIKTSPAEYFDDEQIDEAVNLVNHDQTDIRGPQNDLYDRFYRRNSSNKMTLLGKEYISRKSKINDADPKILVSHFHNEYDSVNMDNFSRQISITRVSPYSEKEASVGKQFSEFMKRKTQKNFTVIGKQRGTKLLEDPLKRKSPYTARVGATRNASGRLLGIMAKQALVGRNPEISKAFQVALVNKNF